MKIVFALSLGHGSGNELVEADVGMQRPFLFLLYIFIFICDLRSEHVKGSFEMHCAVLVCCVRLPATIYTMNEHSKGAGRTSLVSGGWSVHKRQHGRRFVALTLEEICQPGSSARRTKRNCIAKSLLFCQIMGQKNYEIEANCGKVFAPLCAACSRSYGSER